MAFKDPEKRRAYRRKWYKENKKSEKIHIKRRRQELRMWFKETKKTLSCVKCGENHPAVLEFHHTQKKEKEINKMVRYGYSIKKIIREMEKCIVLCSNCHQKLHYKERNKP